MSPIQTTKRKHQRKLRNYLLNPRLQFRYTAPIVLTSVAITLGLGLRIYESVRATSEIIELTGVTDPVVAAELQSQFAASDQTVVWGIAGFSLVLVLLWLFWASSFLTKLRDRCSKPLRPCRASRTENWYPSRTRCAKTTNCRTSSADSSRCTTRSRTTSRHGRRSLGVYPD